MSICWWSWIDCGWTMLHYSTFLAFLWAETIALYHYNTKCKLKSISRSYSITQQHYNNIEDHRSCWSRSIMQLVKGPKAEIRSRAPAWRCRGWTQRDSSKEPTKLTERLISGEFLPSARQDRKAKPREKRWLFSNPPRSNMLSPRVPSLKTKLRKLIGPLTAIHLRLTAFPPYWNKPSLMTKMTWRRPISAR